MKMSLSLTTGLLFLTLGCHRNVQPTIQADLASKVTEGEVIEAIEVSGHIQITNDAIRHGLHSRLGDHVNLPVIKSDIEFLYSLGFEAVRVDEESGSHGKIVVFHVKEKATP